MRYKDIKEKLKKELKTELKAELKEERKFSESKQLIKSLLYKRIPVFLPEGGYTKKDEDEIGMLYSIIFY